LRSRLREEEGLPLDPWRGLVGFDPVVGFVSIGLALGTPVHRAGSILTDPLGFRTFGVLRFRELSNPRGTDRGLICLVQVLIWSVPC